jgi:hypothetical protein
MKGKRQNIEKSCTAVNYSCVVFRLCDRTNFSGYKTYAWLGSPVGKSAG